MKIIINRAKVHRLTSKVFCSVMIAMAIVSLTSCEKNETTTISGYVYLSNGNSIQGVYVLLNGNISYSSPSSAQKGIIITETTTNRDGYYEMKFNADYKTYGIVVRAGETMSGKRWREYDDVIKIVSGENNTVNVYLQLY